MRFRSLGGKTRRDNSAKVPRKRECGGGLDRRRQGTKTERLHTHFTYHTILNVVYHSILICIIHDLCVKSHLYGIDYSASLVCILRRWANSSSSLHPKSTSFSTLIRAENCVTPFLHTDQCLFRRLFV